MNQATHMHPIDATPPVLRKSLGTAGVARTPGGFVGRVALVESVPGTIGTPRRERWALHITRPDGSTLIPKTRDGRETTFPLQPSRAKCERMGVDVLRTLDPKAPRWLRFREATDFYDDGKPAAA